MNLRKLILTENACYKAGKKITVKGIMVHSTGANNPWLKRYVGPDDGLLGKNQYNNIGTPITPAAERFAFMPLLANWLTARLPHTKLCHGITVVGTPEVLQTTPISALKSVRTVSLMHLILRRCTRRPLNFVRTFARSMVLPKRISSATAKDTARVLPQITEMLCIGFLSITSRWIPSVQM